ncbi:uncharacterized protein LOC134280791 [Saccostrea cucullata]|uniref:uncharacterized protein LOC134280791 n=1 Tax=Saccostrea cuccullata TaxID=36930 RepID=UPI002ED5F722
METECKVLIGRSFSPSVNYFTSTERTTLHVFLHKLNSEELRKLLEAFKLRLLISDEFYCFLHEFYLRESDKKSEMFDLISSHLSQRCKLGLNYVVLALSKSKCKNFAEKLYNFRLMIDLLYRQEVVHRRNISNRKKIEVFFESTKRRIQNMNFLNSVNRLKQLSDKISQEIYTSIFHWEEKIIRETCDKYVVLLALTTVSQVNKSSEINAEDESFQNMEAIISMTSCPDLSRCMLYSRRAVVLALANRKEKGEDLVREALICADRVSGYLEIVDLHYKIVLFHSAWFEYDPQIITNRIDHHTQIALQILENQPEDVRVFWTRRFMFRLLFCFLGLGMRCRFIENFNCPSYILQEAERLLDKYDSSQAEYRLQMYFSIAKSRLWHLKGDNNMSLKHLPRAKTIAEKGRYSELETIQYAEETLRLRIVKRYINNDVGAVYLTEPIQLPPSYCLPQSTIPNDRQICLTSPPSPSLPIPMMGPQNVAQGVTSVSYIQEDTEKPRRSHDFSKEAIHIKSSKRNNSNV